MFNTPVFGCLAPFICSPLISFLHIDFDFQFELPIFLCVPVFPSHRLHPMSWTLRILFVQSRVRMAQRGYLMSHVIGTLAQCRVNMASWWECMTVHWLLINSFIGFLLNCLSHILSLLKKYNLGSFLEMKTYFLSCLHYTIQLH